jgi:hypothetical protein
VPLENEFAEYREANNLWCKVVKSTSYQINGNEVTRVRIADGMVGEPEVFYTKQSE